MTDKRVSKLAAILTNYCLEAKRNEIILIASPIAGLPLIKEIYRKILQKKAHPIVNIVEPDFERILCELGTRAQLNFIPDFERVKAKTINKIVTVYAPANTRDYSEIHPEKKIIRAKTLQNIIYKSSCDVCVCFPTNALAQDAGMSLEAYEAFLYKSTNRNWNQFSKKWKKYLSLFKEAEEINIKGFETDLTMNVKGRKFILEDAKTNMPGGEIYTAPVEDSVNGHIFFEFPGIYENVEVNKVRLKFKDGRVVDAGAEQGEDYLIKLLNSDSGSRYLGEFAFGLNYTIKKFTKEILFDEKIGGTIHVALGSAYPECKGKNNSSIHWDLIKDMRKGGEIYLDGNLIHKNGKFKPTI